jgi:hypothetical protein
MAFHIMFVDDPAFLVSHNASDNYLGLVACTKNDIQACRMTQVLPPPNFRYIC